VAGAGAASGLRGFGLPTAAAHVTSSRTRGEIESRSSDPRPRQQADTLVLRRDRSLGDAAAIAKAEPFNMPDHNAAQPASR